MSEQQAPPAPVELVEGEIVGDAHVVGPPGPLEWRAMREQALSICDTEFVPKEMRGSPEKVLAAILTGRELGIGPMASLQGIRIENGKPAYDAELMRALVRRRGHQIKAKVKTHTECIVWGQRCDTGEEAEVRWTLADAKIANLIDSIKDDGLPQARSSNNKPMPWEQYPRRMLFARATSELVADLFADVLVGGSYTPEELGAIDDWDHEDPEQATRVESARLVGLIDAAIAAESITGPDAQKAAQAHGLRTRDDVVKASPEVLRSVLATLGIAEDGSEPPTGPEQPSGGDPDQPAEPTSDATPDDALLADRVRASEDFEWKPAKGTKSGNAAEERSVLLKDLAEVIERRQWTDSDVQTLLGGDVDDVVQLVGNAQVDVLRTIVETLEAEDRRLAESEDPPLDPPPGS